MGGESNRKSIPGAVMDPDSKDGLTPCEIQLILSSPPKRSAAEPHVGDFIYKSPPFRYGFPPTQVDHSFLKIGGLGPGGLDSERILLRKGLLL